ncbi:hypothetical protein C8J57DRAFT_202048 [Mycena rebaudengoi]|nr:hypothetical protein C8J57DRAFT_202048 [Mycena rebaudengoi]
MVGDASLLVAVLWLSDVELIIASRGVIASEAPAAHKHQSTGPRPLGLRMEQGVDICPRGKRKLECRAIQFHCQCGYGGVGANIGIALHGDCYSGQSMRLICWAAARRIVLAICGTC